MSGRTYAEVSFTAAAHGERLGDMAMPLRLVREHAGDYPTEWAAITAVSSRLDELGDAAQVGPQLTQLRRLAAGNPDLARR